MRTRLLLSLLLVAALVMPSVHAWQQPAPQVQGARAGRLRAGAAKVDITPKESELAVATDTIRDHLFVRAIVVDNGVTCAALVGMDLGGARDPVMLDALPRAVAATGCPERTF